MTTLHGLPTKPQLTADTFYRYADSLLKGWSLVDEGHSVLGRPLRCYHRGTGGIKVLIWTQMHGNESSASYSILDLLHHWENNPSEAGNTFRTVSLYIIPILNPDGAESFSRYNALGIDINRDARTAVSPEAKFLLDCVKKIEPHWAFNMHDQRSIFSVGESGMPATISLLAPAFSPDYFGIIHHRERAISLIGCVVSKWTPNALRETARFSDAFYPLAMGDYFQEMGIATILVETGGCVINRDTGRLRTTNFLLQALHCICHPNTRDLAHSGKYYYALQENKDALRDVKLLNCKVGNFVLDFAFQLQFVPNKDAFLLVFDSAGKLNHLKGYWELDMKNETSVSLSEIQFQIGTVIEKLPLVWKNAIQNNHTELWNSLA
ncbi:MAG: hypothetical protein JJU02_04925 [Cryomorphaceae bacterium]|nr:hypothetical protein [Cryomorphaceae bacterium]